jgi:hypothetical protein
LTSWVELYAKYFISTLWLNSNTWIKISNPNRILTSQESSSNLITQLDATSLDNYIRQEIVKKLKRKYNYIIALLILHQRLKSWNIPKRIYTNDFDILRARLVVLFFQFRLNNEELLRILQIKEYQIDFIDLTHLRHKLRLYR